MNDFTFPALAMGEVIPERAFSFFQNRINSILNPDKKLLRSLLLKHIEENCLCFSKPSERVVEAYDYDILILDATWVMPGCQTPLVLLEKCPKEIIEGLFLLAIIMDIKDTFIFVPETAADLYKSLTEMIYKFQTEVLTAHAEKLSSLNVQIYETKNGYTPNKFMQANVLNAAPEAVGRTGLYLEKSILAPHQMQTVHTKILGLCGDIHAPQVVEVPMGALLKDVINTTAKGVVGGWRHLNGIFINGAFSKMIIGEVVNQLMVSDESFMQHDFVLGGGDLLIVNQSQDMASLCLSTLRFVSNRKDLCVACQKGFLWIIPLFQQLFFYGDTSIEREINYVCTFLEKECSCGVYEKSSPFLLQMQHMKDFRINAQKKSSVTVLHHD